MSFKQRAISMIQEFADEPVQEDFNNYQEFKAAHDEWELAQKGPQVGNDDQDPEHGPGVTGWVDPDTVTGPSFK